MTVPENTQDSNQQIQIEDDWESDEQFSRLRRMTESLIEEAQKALVYEVPDDTDHHHRRSRRSRQRKE